MHDQKLAPLGKKPLSNVRARKGNGKIVRYAGIHLTDRDMNGQRERPCAVFVFFMLTLTIHAVKHAVRKILFLYGAVARALCIRLACKQNNVKFFG